MRLNKRIALITGAARGIGENIARLFIQEGATVILTDIRDDEGQALCNELGSTALYHHLDVSSEDDWKILADFIELKFGYLDILVNNAGIIGFEHSENHDPEHCTLDAWRHVHQVNLDSVFLGCRLGIHFMKSGGGSIINMSSRSGLVGIPRAVAYASSKAAIRNHTKSVALYCAEEGYKIRVNAICPAAILTPMWDAMLGTGEVRKEMIKQIEDTIPMHHMGEPLDVANAALYLASEESKYMTGSEIHLDGGILAGSAATPKRAESTQ